MNGSNKFGSLIALVALIGCFFVSPLLIFYNRYATAFIAFSILLTVFCICVGLALNGRAGGLIVDSRNRMSLSKLQAAAWTVIVLAGWSTFVIVRLRTGTDSMAAAIAIPNQLLAAMGISAASLVAAPMVLNLKKEETPDPDKLAAAANRLGDDLTDVANAGNVYARKMPASAQWMDLFRGDDVGNAANADLSKVQQFLVTVIVLIVYAGAIVRFLVRAEPPGNSDLLASLPPLNETVVWLIGISHTGYIAYKATPHGGSGAAAPVGIATDASGAAG